MIQLQDLRKFLDGLLSGNGVADYCPNGLQVQGAVEISKIATAVSADLKTIEAAINSGANALIVHHGLFWQKDSYVIEGVKRKKVGLLIENNLSLFAYHLPLDLHPHLGNNWKAARDLGWKNLEPFGYLNAVPIGVKGRIEGTPREVLKKQLENYYQHEAYCALGGPKQIETVALISGGAHKSIREAALEGVDAFITGSFDEPTWHQANEEIINFYALGHAATEKIGPMALANYIQNQLHVQTLFIETDNPF